MTFAKTMYIHAFYHCLKVIPGIIICYSIAWDRLWNHMRRSVCL